jgi:hypothetical protein
VVLCDLRDFLWFKNVHRRVKEKKGAKVLGFGVIQKSNIDHKAPVHQVELGENA